MDVDSNNPLMSILGQGTFGNKNQTLDLGFQTAPQSYNDDRIGSVGFSDRSNGVMDEAVDFPSGYWSSMICFDDKGPEPCLFFDKLDELVG